MDKIDRLFNRPKITWDGWVNSNQGCIDYFNGQISTIRQPNWHASPFKGGNAHDFSNVHLKNIEVYEPFAEGITFKNSTFNNIFFSDGDFSGANFTNCNFLNCKFNKTIFTNACFYNASFENCNLNRINLTSADFRVKRIHETVIYGISVWDINISDDSVQSRLVIEKTYDLYSEIIKDGRIPLMVDNIELAQFIYYLSNHKKLRDTLNILNNRGILLLGKFKDGGLERLYKIKEWFTKNNYLPMIFDFDRPPNLDYTETIITLSGLSKLIVADLSGDSVPHELHAILTNFTKPVVAYYDKEPYSMSKDLRRKNRYFHELKYSGITDELLKKLPNEIQAAEEDFKQIIIDLSNEY